MAMHDADSLIATLERAPALVIPLVREVPALYLKRRPGPGRWSAHEHACHIATDHPLFFGRLDRMLGEEAPRITPVDASQDPPGMLMSMDLDESLARFARERGELVERLRLLTPAEWERRGRHPDYPVYTVFVMFRHLAMHGMLHAYRIEELMLKKDW
jgi:hypothetical protein